MPSQARSLPIVERDATEPYSVEQINAAVSAAADPNALPIAALESSKAAAVVVACAEDLVLKGAITLKAALEAVQAHSLRAGVLLAVIDAAGADSIAAAMFPANGGGDDVADVVTPAEVAEALAADRLATGMVQ